MKITATLACVLLSIIVGCKKDTEVIETPYVSELNIPCQVTSITEYFIDGYTDKISYSPNEESKVYLSTSSSLPRTIVRLLDIQGQIIDFVECSTKTQVITNLDPFENGFGYEETFRYTIPDDLPSGIYLWEGKIPFVVKTTTQTDILVLYDSNTEQSYNEAGGKSYYTTDRSPILSFQRPVKLPRYSDAFLRWIALQSYNVGYLADVDMENYTHLQYAKILVVIGHSEYWTRKARENFDAFVNNGNHAIVLSGNTMWWQVRYNPDTTQLVCYGYGEDPEGENLYTTTLWNTPMLNYPIIASIGADFTNGGYGVKEDKGWDGYKIVSENSPLLQLTGMKNDMVFSLPSKEYDGAPVVFNAEKPTIDQSALNFYKAELIGYDFGFRSRETVGTFIAFQKTATSGYIINTGSTNWCSNTGIDGIDKDVVRQITLNAIELLIKNQSVFSPELTDK